MDVIELSDYKGALANRACFFFQDFSLPGQANGLRLLGDDATLLQKVVGDPRIQSKLEFTCRFQTLVLYRIFRR